MTIRDLIKAGVDIQGNVCVRIWDEDKNDYCVEKEMDAVTDTELYELGDFLLDRKIWALYPIMGYNKNDMDVPAMVIELEPKGEDE